MINLTNDGVKTTEMAVGVLHNTAILESRWVLRDETFSFCYLCIKEISKPQEWYSTEKILIFALSSEYYY